MEEALQIVNAIDVHWVQSKLSLYKLWIKTL